MLVTPATLYKRRIAAIRDTLPSVRHVIVINDTGLFLATLDHVLQEPATL